MLKIKESLLGLELTVRLLRKPRKMAEEFKTHHATFYYLKKSENWPKTVKLCKLTR